MIEKNPHNSILGIEMADSINQLFCGQIIHWEYGQNIIIISHHRSSLWRPTFGLGKPAQGHNWVKTFRKAYLNSYLSFHYLVQ